MLSRREEQKVPQVMKHASPACQPRRGMPPAASGRTDPPGSVQHTHVSGAFPKRVSKCFRNGNS